MKLSNCSFCGCSPQVVFDPVSVGYKEYFISTYVFCTSCQTRCPAFSDFDYPSGPDRIRLATDGWNKIHAQSKGKT